MIEDQSIWQQFVDLAASADSDIDLATAALLIAAAEYPDLDIAGQIAILDSLSAGAAKRLGEDRDPLFTVNTLSEYLFDEIGFSGNQEDYYDPRNSFLNEVLSRRVGIPITLSLVCIEVGKRLEIPLVGVGMPGHFLLRHRDEEDLFIDPYHRGVLLSEEECAQRLRQVAGANVAWDSRFLTPVSNRDYIARILRNLKAIFAEQRDHQRALAMINRLVALYPESPHERRDRGLVHYQLQHHEEALADLKFYLDATTANRETEAIQLLVSRLENNLGN